MRVQNRTRDTVKETNRVPVVEPRDPVVIPMLENPVHEGFDHKRAESKRRITILFNASFHETNLDKVIVDEEMAAQYSPNVDAQRSDVTSPQLYSDTVANGGFYSLLNDTLASGNQFLPENAADLYSYPKKCLSTMASVSDPVDLTNPVHRCALGTVADSNNRSVNPTTLSDFKQIFMAGDAAQPQFSDCAYGIAPVAAFYSFVNEMAAVLAPDIPGLYSFPIEKSLRAKMTTDSDPLYAMASDVPSAPNLSENVDYQSLEVSNTFYSVDGTTLDSSAGEFYSFVDDDSAIMNPYLIPNFCLAENDDYSAISLFPESNTMNESLKNPSYEIEGYSIPFENIEA